MATIRTLPCPDRCTNLHICRTLIYSACMDEEDTDAAFYWPNEGDDDFHREVYRFLDDKRSILYSCALEMRRVSDNEAEQRLVAADRARVASAVRPHTPISLDRTASSLMLIVRLAGEWHDNAPTPLPQGLLPRIAYVQLDDYEPLAIQELLDTLVELGFPDLASEYRSKVLEGISENASSFAVPRLRYDG